MSSQEQVRDGRRTEKRERKEGKRERVMEGEKGMERVCVRKDELSYSPKFLSTFCEFLHLAVLNKFCSGISNQKH